MDITAKTTERNQSMDLLRIIASIMVVFTHITIDWKYKDYGSFGWRVSIIYDCITTSAVPVFFMLSGAFYKNDEFIIARTKNKAIRFILLFFISSIFYTFSDLIYTKLNENLIWGGYEFLEKCLKYKYHLWYIPAYIYVLLAAPLVVSSLDKEKKYYSYVIGIWILFSIVFNTLYILCSGSENSLFDILRKFFDRIAGLCFLTGNNIGFFITGRYLKNQKLKVRTRRCIYSISIFSLVISYVLTEVYSFKMQSYFVDWLKSSCVLVIAEAVGLFVLFDNIHINNSRIIKKITECTLGVYLVHVLFLDWLKRLNFFEHNMIWGIYFNPLVNIMFRTAIVYSLSLILVLVYKSVVECLLNKVRRYKY